MQNREGKWSGPALWIGLLLFVVALVLRILFLLATPGADGTHSPWYIGDTPTWLNYALAIQSSNPFDQGLPMRPPGVAYLVATVWNGQETGLFLLRLVWSVLGAAVVAMFYIAVLRSFGLRVAIVAAFIAAASTGLMIVSTSVNNEIPYLLLVMTSFTLWEPIRRQPHLLTLLSWSALHALACLIRIEHILFFTLVSAYLVWTWTRLPGQESAWKHSLGKAVLLFALFALPLLPWQLHIFSQLEKFNHDALPIDQATEQAYFQLEQALAGLDWSAEANQQLAALPAFSRRTMSNFVAATVAVRGESEVSGEHMHIIEEAFGSRPEPIAAYPFIAIYGGLNFYLANNPLASGGFSTAPLEAPPPLSGGPSRYPGILVNGLPPPELALTYPPHLHIVNNGYRLGREWILNHPGDYLSLVGRKLGNFWAGITLGFTGYNLPLGLSGVRRPVDLVVPEGEGGIVLWRWALFALLLAGLWAGRGEEALAPWLLLLLTKLITTLGFYGYAREGVVVIPVLALLLALLATREMPRLLPRSRASPNVRKWLQLTCVLALIVIAAEAYRWKSEPVITLDDLAPGAVDLLPGTEYEERRIRVR
jgi:hypothetical protein